MMSDEDDDSRWDDGWWMIMMTRQEEDNGDYGRKWSDQQIIVQPDSLRWEAEMWTKLKLKLKLHFI